MSTFQEGWKNHKFLLTSDVNEVSSKGVGVLASVTRKGNAGITSRYESLVKSPAAPATQTLIAGRDSPAFSHHDPGTVFICSSIPVSYTHLDVYKRQS